MSRHHPRCGYFGEPDDPQGCCCNCGGSFLAGVEPARLAPEQSKPTPASVVPDGSTGSPSTEITCPCIRCVDALGPLTLYMILCPDCGNKRCPHAEFHGWACTRSNEPGQVPVLIATPDPRDAQISELKEQIARYEEEMGLYLRGGRMEVTERQVSTLTAENQRLRDTMGEMQSERDELKANYLRVAKAIGVSVEPEGHASQPGPLEDILHEVHDLVTRKGDAVEFEVLQADLEDAETENRRLREIMGDAANVDRRLTYYGELESKLRHVETNLAELQAAHKALREKYYAARMVLKSRTVLLVKSAAMLAMLGEHSGPEVLSGAVVKIIVRNLLRRIHEELEKK